MEESTGDGDLLQEAARVLERARELQESAASLISKVKNEEQSLCKQALALDVEIRQLRRSVEDAARNESLDLAAIDKVEEELYKAKCLMSDGDASSFLPVKSDGKFLRMFLGPINVRASRKDVQLKVKEEYNSYKDRTAILFLLFPCLLLFLRNQMWNGCFPALPFQLYQAWLLFFFM